MNITYSEQIRLWEVAQEIQSFFQLRILNIQKKILMNDARSSQISQTTKNKLMKIEKKIWEKTSDFKLHDEKKLLS